MKIWLFVKRWVKRIFKRLVFRLRREGWAEEFAKDILSSVNGATSIEATWAYTTFVRNMAKIKRSRISTEEKIHWIEDEKRILRLYGFNYRHPDKLTRIQNEQIKEWYIVLQGCSCHPSIFATS